MFILALRVLIFSLGLATVIGTFFSALSTFLLPRAARSHLNRLVFGLLRRLVEIPLMLSKDYRSRDAVMAYFAPLGLMLLVPTWYVLISIGYAAMYWALGGLSVLEAYTLSGSSLLTLGCASSDHWFATILIFSEATLGLVLVSLLIAYLPTMYSAFSRREQAVNLLDVRAGNPPSAVELILRYHSRAAGAQRRRRQSLRAQGRPRGHPARGGARRAPAAERRRVRAQERNRAGGPKFVDQYINALVPDFIQFQLGWFNTRSTNSNPVVELTP